MCCRSEHALHVSPTAHIRHGYLFSFIVMVTKLRLFPANAEHLGKFDFVQPLTKLARLVLWQLNQSSSLLGGTCKWAPGASWVRGLVEGPRAPGPPAGVLGPWSMLGAASCALQEPAGLRDTRAPWGGRSSEWAARLPLELVVSQLNFLWWVLGGKKRKVITHYHTSKS